MHTDRGRSRASVKSIHKRIGRYTAEYEPRIKGNGRVERCGLLCAEKSIQRQRYSPRVDFEVSPILFFCREWLVHVDLFNRRYKNSFFKPFESGLFNNARSNIITQTIVYLSFIKFVI